MLPAMRRMTPLPARYCWPATSGALQTSLTGPDTGGEFATSVGPLMNWQSVVQMAATIISGSRADFTRLRTSIAASNKEGCSLMSRKSALPVCRS